MQTRPTLDDVLLKQVLKPLPTMSSSEGGDKDVARDSRLSLRKTNQEVIRKQLQESARKQCAQEVKTFAECAKREGFFVVFKCREELKLSKSPIETINN